MNNSHITKLTSDEVEKPKEDKKLNTDEYQNKIAQALFNLVSDLYD